MIEKNFRPGKLSKKDPRLVIERQPFDDEGGNFDLRYDIKYGKIFREKKHGYVTVDVRKPQLTEFLKRRGLSKERPRVFSIRNFYPNKNEWDVGRNVAKRTIRILVKEAKEFDADIIIINTPKPLLKVLLKKEGFETKDKDVLGDKVEYYYKILDKENKENLKR